MAAYLAVPLKKTWEVDLNKPLQTFISTTFTGTDPEEHRNACLEFHKLRNNMIAKSLDKHEAALDVLYRYYDQLVAMEGKFPIVENQIRINFKWQNAFHKDSWLSGKGTLTVASASYEKVCMLFNMAALQTQVAESQNHDSDEGLKSSAKLLQQAAGIFAHLKDCVLSNIQNDPTPDMQPDTLWALSALMIAQAQDCFCRKAIKDQMKPTVIAKVAFQCSEHYAEAMKLLQLTSIRDLWPKEWIPTAVMKQAAFHGLAEYYQSQAHAENKEFGTQIARLQHAKELMDAAESRGGFTFSFKGEANRTEKALADAKKDNNFIYHDKIPDCKALTPLTKAPISKPLPVASPMSSKFTDLFVRIVPLAVHQALGAFENRKAAIVNMEIGKLREATQLLNSILVSLNLPAALEDLSGAKVPDSVHQKAMTVREKGGIGMLSQLMNELPESLTRNREMLTEIVNMLDEEQKSDDRLREQFKERWTRTPSDKLNQPFKTEMAKYEQILTNAVQADKIVQDKFNAHKEGIELLSKSDAEIETALPSGSPVAALKDVPAVTELRQLMEQVDAIKAERDVMENEFKDAKCDMSSKFMSALASDGAVNEEVLSDDQLEEVYGPLRTQVKESIDRQESLLASIQQANTQFGDARAQNQSAAQREQMLKSIAAAYDIYIELKANLEEGNKFYNDLTRILVKFQEKVSDLCFARRTEKEELMKDLQSKIANQPASAPPQHPAFQKPTPAPRTSVQPAASSQGQEEGKGTKVPPPRPPPPTRPPAPQVTAASSGTVMAAQPPAAQPPVATAPGYPPAGAAATPYPVAPQAGYVPMPMPAAYNPWGYGYPQQNPYPAQPYPQQYTPYPQQQWPRQ